MAFADNHDVSTPASLPHWLQWQAHKQPAGIALRHKFLGVWQQRSWQQLADEVVQLASALQQRGFGDGATLVVLSRPRPEALLLSLAAQWLGGAAALFDPLDKASEQIAVLRTLQTDYVFAESVEEWQRLQTALPHVPVRIYADGRGVPRAEGLAYDTLAQANSTVLLAPVTRRERTAFIFLRQTADGIEQQRISHAELLQEGRRLVEAEQLGRHEEALAARAFAAGGQARYLLAPWLVAGFRLNFPENLFTRDQDRRELGPTLVAGTRDTFGRLHEQVLSRLGEPGSLHHALVHWALAPQPGLLRRTLGYWLVRRPLRDVLGLARTRVPLLVGDALPAETQAFFAALGVPVRTWPDKAQWQRSIHTSASPVSGWVDADVQWVG